MEKIEKQMLLVLLFLVIVLTLGIFRLNKVMVPIAADVEKNGIKPYVMQLWEGKKN